MAHIKSHAYWERVKIIDKSFLVLENLLGRLGEAATHAGAQTLMADILGNIVLLGIYQYNV